MIDQISPGELHLHIGVVNHIFDKLQMKWPVYKWAEENGIAHAGYQGGEFAGNECKLLLLKAPQLMQALPDDLKKFATCLNHFDHVRKACFGETLLSNYKSNIDAFKKCYLSLGISVTPKVHCVFTHVDEFCSKTGQALGIFSEQSSESSHKDFASCWERYKVRASHQSYSNAFLRSVLAYNAFHV